MSVKDMTNEQLNIALDVLLGAKVDRGRPGNVIKGNYSASPKDYCTDPAASLEVQAKAIELDAALYLKTLSTKVYGSTYEKVEKYDLIALIEVKRLLLASPRERAEAAYMHYQFTH
ncbi:hypothetical protein GMA19_03059 [Paenibacillus polymyxa E681]|uniref:hypothetical protein n=1 Tax=Paenibacillus polymyxa TaxID=1406 RepID=UPI0005C65B93|nr:hypothetical protein [Paenibacillus polymyxa]AJW69273.1 hypothetical protein PPE_06030 [Paenibacillus polymyxa E681]QNV57888.1 hypothetical protein GE561_03059 [Paenibacillus polymyxa E681]QNV62725.1 hypothetical protein GMA19_03059 [Paenibacillus polymyxa E681]